ncbi:MAG TPA: phosphate ABC transporter substrate-binding protein [Phycisphaerae bacterium]|nr:phosphate ABC transporter substrate-binding protein [Phycisphaerae bacterium]
MVVVSFATGGRSGHRTVNVVGSTSIQPFAEMLSEEYRHRRPGAKVEVQGGGSTAGLQACAEGIADIGTCSRGLKEDEARRFRGITIALDGLAVVVHRSNPVSGLSGAQIRDIFSGAISNWSEVGGNDQPIRLITREEGSGTREAFVKLVMQAKGPAGGVSAPPANGQKEPARISRRALTQESNGAVKELVRHDPAAIGYMSLGLVGGDLNILTVDGVHPSTGAVAAGRYPLVRPFLFVVKGQPGAEAQAFIDFVLSPSGQQVLEKEGLVRAP